MELASADDCLAGEAGPSPPVQAGSNRTQGASVGTSEGWGPERQGWKRHLRLRVGAQGSLPDHPLPAQGPTGAHS